MKTGLLLLVFVSLVAGSCQNSECGPCPVNADPSALYAVLSIPVRIVDKVSGADLFLSPTSPYKPSDLKVTNAANDSVSFWQDVLGTGDRFIRIPSPESQTFKLKLASLSSNTINVVLASDSPVCCPVTRIKSITLDNVQVCGPCRFTQMVTIKK